MERTFVMLKPGILQRRLVGQIITRFEAKGFSILALKMRMITPDMAQRHYAEHCTKAWFAELEHYITSGPVLTMVIQGDQAIARVRQLCGATKVEDAQPGTIRGDFAMHTGANVIHSSDSPASADREIALFFQDQDIIDYPDPSGSWI